jgi:nicotinamidase-related amidase
MKTAGARRTALIIIDVQNGFHHPTHWGPSSSRSTPECETNIAQLLSAAREHNDKLNATEANDSSAILICHVHHHSIDPNSELHPSKTIEVNGQLLRSVAPQAVAAPRPGETVWIKNVNSGFVGTGLEGFMRLNEVRQLVICGLTTDHCVSTTTRMASNLRVVDIIKEDGEVAETGDIVLVGDACATYAKGGFDSETIHRVNLASLNGEFAVIEQTVDVVREVFKS